MNVTEYFFQAGSQAMEPDRTDWFGQNPQGGVTITLGNGSCTSLSGLPLYEIVALKEALRFWQ